MKKYYLSLRVNFNKIKSIGSGIITRKHSKDFFEYEKAFSFQQTPFL